MADIQPPEGQSNAGGGTLILNPVEPLTGVGSKRQRRPSVRLGDIGGDPLHDSHSRKHYNNPSGIIKPSKTRPLTNLDDRDPSTNFKLKKRASTKRLRSNWVSRFDGDDKHSAAEDLDDGYREFHLESPIHSMENLGVGGLLLHRRSSSFKGRDHHDGVELSGPSDTDARDWKCGDENDGVRVWLDGLGLGRYAPVFQVHEVDDEVLPMLTLEDLKDMGITAVGTRRKMYCAIQKLGKGFS